MRSDFSESYSAAEGHPEMVKSLQKMVRDANVHFASVSTEKDPTRLLRVPAASSQD
jgi:hypothetical protein